MKPTISYPYELTPEDLSKWLYNTRVFLAPCVVVFLGTWISTHDWRLAAMAFLVFAANSLYDLLRKWTEKNTYK